MSETQVGIQGVDFREQRRSSLVSPYAFTAALGTSSTAIYTGNDTDGLLIRHFAVANTTGAALNLTVTVAGSDYVTAKQVAANDAVRLDALTGLYIDPEDDVAGLGSAVGLRVYGWGLRVRGGSAWTL